MAYQKKGQNLQYRAYDSTNIQRMSPNKDDDYDGPKNFKEICIEINRRLGYDSKVVSKLITYFLYRTIFLKLKSGKQFSLRGIGNFLPWKVTQKRAAEGKRPVKYNVDGKGLSHNVTSMRKYKRRFKDRQQKKKDNLQEGWDF